MKRWHRNENKFLENEIHDNFLKELFELYDKYDISISHEDRHGSFILESNNKYNREWINEASIYGN